MRVLAYCRVSDDSQKLGDGFPRQELAMNNYAKFNDLEIAQVFHDEVSGTTESINRPAWVRMVTYAQSNGITTILVECMNRLARDLMVQEHIILDLQRRGLTLISVTEPYLNMEGSDPSRKLIRQILGAIAEYDKSMSVLRMRAAKDRIKATGAKCEGRKAYGDRPGETEILELIQSSREGGLTLWAICHTLTASGHKSRYGGKWHPGTVQRILLRNKAVA